MKITYEELQRRISLSLFEKIQWTIERYIEVENKIGHTFRAGFSIASVRKAIDDNYQTKVISDWVM